MLQTNYRHKYNPNEIGQEEFLASFVVRKEIFQEIFDDIKQTDFSVPSQHFVIIGQRGQGKTTLLRKLYLEIKQDEQLSSFLIPVQLAEEQYQVRTLCTLWEVIAEHLEDSDGTLFNNITTMMENYSQDDDYEFDCFKRLEKEITKHRKKIVLLIDNIDELFGKLKEKETRQLREILMTSSTFKIIGGSTKMFENHYDYSKEFYQFFKVILLKGLTQNETMEFLKAITNNEQKEKLDNIVQHQYSKINTLRQLTGGVPRTLTIVFDIFMDDDGKVFDDLVKVLDEATPLYKHRMDDLPPVLQDIVHTIALNWDGMLTKDIATKTKLTSKEVSAQLKQLEKYKIVESVFMGKNKIYKIEERFFNIWYLMRFGRKKERNKVEWLVKFLSMWFTQEELKNKSTQLIQATKNGKVKEPQKALELVRQSYETLKDYANTHTFATVLLWNEEFTQSYEKFDEFLGYQEALDAIEGITEYFTLLIAKGQYYKAKEYFDNETYQLKDRAKPIWYALMTLMQDEFPHEIKKMGSELQESVDDILKTIEELKQK